MVKKIPKFPDLADESSASDGEEGLKPVFNDHSGRFGEYNSKSKKGIQDLGEQ